MKEIIERAEKLGYNKIHWHGQHLDTLFYEEEVYLDLCLINKWIYEKYGVWINVCYFPGDGFFIYKKGIYEKTYFNNETLALTNEIKEVLSTIEYVIRKNNT